MLFHWMVNQHQAIQLLGPDIVDLAAANLQFDVGHHPEITDVVILQLIPHQLSPDGGRPRAVVVAQRLTEVWVRSPWDVRKGGP